MADDFDIVCSKIEQEKEFLNAVSQEIWRNPELCYKEVNAHAFLSNTLEKCGFKVEKHYLLDTAFKAEYASRKDLPSGPTVAILLEYDALPEVGHACGHNLIAECGLAAAIAVKEVMERDPSVPGKLLVMGTPAEEGGGGKIKLLEKGAFKGVDVALMVHPTNNSNASPPCLAGLMGTVVFTGKEAHAAASPWNGINALDAAVICYNNLSVLRQQILPDQRIHAIIKEGGVAVNVIPSIARLDISIRALTTGQMKRLRSKVEACINGAAMSTGCEVTFTFDEANCYQNLISNKVLVDIYRKYFLKLGMAFDDDLQTDTFSTDMGNVSHILPAYHPSYPIPSKGVNHAKEFAEAAGQPTAQEPTLAAAKAMAMTAISVLRYPDVRKKMKQQFQQDIEKDNN